MKTSHSLPSEFFSAKESIFTFPFDLSTKGKQGLPQHLKKIFNQYLVPLNV